MENKTTMKVNDKILSILKALLCSYLVTGILLLALAFLLYQFHLEEKQIDIGILAIYVISTILGGFLCGKFVKKRKFIWGMLSGTIYYLLLLAVSLGVYKSLQQGSTNMITTLILCIGGGMIGGMIS